MKIVLSTNIIRSLAVPAPLIFTGIWLIFSQVNVVFAQSQQGREEQNIQLEQNTRYSEYEVKEGETLYSISKSLGVQVEELKNWNELTGNIISIGQILRYKSQDSSSLTVKKQNEVLETGASIIRSDNIETTEFYTVKSGDNLIRIAEAHDMSVNELKNLNELNSDFIRVGQRLTVKKVIDSVAPVATNFENGSAPQGAFLIYTLPQNLYIDSLLMNFQMSKKELAYLNPDVNIDRLNPGQKITILAPPSRNYDNPYTKSAFIIDIGQVEISVYKKSDRAKTTTTGELYNPEELTAAHASIRLGQVLYVKNPMNDRGIYVRINDRTTENVLQLSNLAHQLLGYGDPIPNSNAKIARIFTLEEL
ncbi:MAG: LysM peptidoglycan-binding domain-containing protein [Bacteroidota bacterium]|nr:LysM peptidoglycan-binding domain-containing protein [Bacteroidota bacterium]